MPFLITNYYKVSMRFHKNGSVHRLISTFYSNCVLPCMLQLGVVLLSGKKTDSVANGCLDNCWSKRLAS